MVASVMGVSASYQQLLEQSSGSSNVLYKGSYYTQSHTVHPETARILEKYQNFDPTTHTIGSITDGGITIPEPIQKTVMSNLPDIGIAEDGGISWFKAALWGSYLLMAAAFLYKVTGQHRGIKPNRNFDVDMYSRHMPAMEDGRYILNEMGHRITLPRGAIYDRTTESYHLPSPAGTRYVPVSGGLFEEPQSYWNE